MTLSLATEIFLTLIVSQLNTQADPLQISRVLILLISLLHLCPGLPGLNIIFSTHGVYCIPPHRDHCSLFCHSQYLPNDYFIYFKHCYRWKSKSHSYSFVFTRCRNFLVFIQTPLQYTKEILAFQFYPEWTTFESRFKSTNMLESLQVP